MIYFSLKFKHSADSIFHRIIRHISCMENIEWTHHSWLRIRLAGTLLLIWLISEVIVIPSLHFKHSVQSFATLLQKNGKLFSPLLFFALLIPMWHMDAMRFDSVVDTNSANINESTTFANARNATIQFDTLKFNSLLHAFQHMIELHLLLLLCTIHALPLTCTNWTWLSTFMYCWLTGKTSNIYKTSTSIVHHLSRN